MNGLSFEHLLDNGSFSDIKLTVNGSQFLLHRGILEQRSNYFKSLFEKNPSLTNHELNFDGDCAGSFNLVLLWLYSSRKFSLTQKTFLSVLKIAVHLRIERLIDALVLWTKSNLDIENVIRVYQSIDKIPSGLPEEFFNALYDRILFCFDSIDPGRLAPIPFDVFLKVISDKSLEASKYRRSLAIVKYIDGNKSLHSEERASLVRLYVEFDWPAHVSLLFGIIEPSQRPPIIQLTAKHFSRLTVDELQRIPFQCMIEILSCEFLDAYDNNFLISRVQTLTQNRAFSNKQNNRQLWKCVSDLGTKELHRRAITIKDLRCLILASVYSDVLYDIKEMILRVGLDPDNVAIFDADTDNPSAEMVFQYDVIFTFTHYQMQNPSNISNVLKRFVSAGGGLVYCYGFCRSDDWGCGEDTLMDLLPFSRGPQINESNCPDIVINDAEHFLTQGLSYFKPGTFAPRSNVALRKGCHLIASYADGVPLIAESLYEAVPTKVVGINLYPVSKGVHRYGFELDQPIVDLFGKAVIYTKGLV